MGNIITMPFAALLRWLYEFTASYGLSIILFALVIKLVLLPVIFLPIAAWIGFRDQAMVALVILCGAPSTVSGYVMAKNMGGDITVTSEQGKGSTFTLTIHAPSVAEEVDDAFDEDDMPLPALNVLLVEDIELNVCKTKHLTNTRSSSADEALKLGVRAKAHNIPSLKLEYGTLVPMRYMNEDKHFKVVSISAFCTVHDFADSRKLGEAILKAIEQYDGTVAVLASGSLSHRFIDDQRAEEGMNSYTREFDRQMDERVVKLWREGQFKEFCNMLPEYADYCYGEGNMHDTVMLLGMLGWDKYDGKVEFITELFPSSGTGQVNAVFPLPA